MDAADADLEKSYQQSSPVDDEEEEERKPNLVPVQLTALWDKSNSACKILWVLLTRALLSFSLLGFVTMAIASMLGMGWITCGQATYDFHGPVDAPPSLSKTAAVLKWLWLLLIFTVPVLYLSMCCCWTKRESSILAIVLAIFATAQAITGCIYAHNVPTHSWYDGEISKCRLRMGFYLFEIGALQLALCAAGCFLAQVLPPRPPKAFASFDAPFKGITLALIQ